MIFCWIQTVKYKNGTIEYNNTLLSLFVEDKKKYIDHLSHLYTLPK